MSKRTVSRSSLPGHGFCAQPWAMLTTIAKLNLTSDVTWLEVSSRVVIVTSHTVSSHTVTLALRSSVAASRGRHSAGCPLRLCFRGSLSGRFGARCLRGRCYRVVFRQLWCQASWFFPTDVLRCIRLPRVFRARPIAPHCPLALTAHRTYFHKSGAAGGPNSAARLAALAAGPVPGGAGTPRAARWAARPRVSTGTATFGLLALQYWCA